MPSIVVVFLTIYIYTYSAIYKHIARGCDASCYWHVKQDASARLCLSLSLSPSLSRLLCCFETYVIDAQGHGWANINYNDYAAHRDWSFELFSLANICCDSELGTDILDVYERHFFAAVYDRAFSNINYLFFENVYNNNNDDVVRLDCYTRRVSKIAALIFLLYLFREEAKFSKVQTDAAKAISLFKEGYQFRFGFHLIVFSSSDASRIVHGSLRSAGYTEKREKTKQRRWNSWKKKRGYAERLQRSICRNSRASYSSCWRERERERKRKRNRDTEKREQLYDRAPMVGNPQPWLYLFSCSLPPFLPYNTHDRYLSRALSIL